MDTAQTARIASIAKQLNSTMNDPVLAGLAVELTVDRVLLYLNTDTLEERLERVVAQIAAQNYNRIVVTRTGNSSERAVRSLKDNGQSITYSDEAVNYFNTASEQEVFGGSIEILKRYRRIDVIS